MHHLLQRSNGFLPTLANASWSEPTASMPMQWQQLVCHLLHFSLHLAGEGFHPGPRGPCLPLTTCGAKQLAPKALSQCLPFLQTLMFAFQLTTFSVSNWRTISCSNPRTPSHGHQFSDALMAVLQLTTFDVSNQCTTPCSNPKVPYHCTLFLHTLMAVFQLTRFSVSNWFTTSWSNPRAFSLCFPFSNALMDALHYS